MMKLDTLLSTLKDKILQKIKKLIEDFEDILYSAIHFNKEWNNIDFDLELNGVKYYCSIYPLDQEESDTIVLRAYADEARLDESEFGNGIWFDSDLGIVNGNDELFFNDNDDKHEEILSALLDKAEGLLKAEEII